jgi:hypothetical protein
MRRKWKLIGLLSLALIAGAGCKSLAPPAVMRPDRPDEFRLPPVDDPQYNRPPEIPKEYLDPKKPRNPFEKDDFLPPMNGGPGGMGGGMGPGGRPGGI